MFEVKLLGKGFCNCCESINDDTVIVKIPSLSHNVITVVCRDCLNLMLDITHKEPTYRIIQFTEEWHPIP